jgi:hypothetical protein
MHDNRYPFLHHLRQIKRRLTSSETSLVVGERGRLVASNRCINGNYFYLFEFYLTLPLNITNTNGGKTRAITRQARSSSLFFTFRDALGRKDAQNDGLDLLTVLLFSKRSLTAIDSIKDHIFSLSFKHCYEQLAV